jgi:hypothetical protein
MTLAHWIGRKCCNYATLDTARQFWPCPRLDLSSLITVDLTTSRPTVKLNKPRHRPRCGVRGQAETTWDDLSPAQNSPRAAISLLALRARLVRAMGVPVLTLCTIIGSFRT